MISFFLRSEAFLFHQSGGVLLALMLAECREIHSR